MLRCVALCSFGLLLVASPAQAQPPKPAAAITLAEVDADFPLQGEYTGDLQLDDGAKRFGVQVIALGDGKFRGVGYPGGLPGDGYDGGEKRSIEAARQGDSVRFEDGEATATLTNGSMTITVNANPIGTLTKVERKSPTLGMKPPAGATVLFDGTTADHFLNGKMTDDHLLMQGVMSKFKFQDATVHLEFQLSYMPAASGQARSNSGCYLQGRYEVQILDSFGLEGKNNECGGIYEVRDPDVNMCFPPLAWQTYDIDFIAPKFDAEGKKSADARMTVKHNGVVVQPDAKVPRITRAAPVQEGPEPGPLYLQDHGNPVRFRNIWVLAK